MLRAYHVSGIIIHFFFLNLNNYTCYRVLGILTTRAHEILGITLKSMPLSRDFPQNKSWVCLPINNSVSMIYDSQLMN